MDAKSTQSLHFKWVDFLRRRGTDAPTYFVHADIEDAFGSIRHDKLVEILRHHGHTLPAKLEMRSVCSLSPGWPEGRRSKSFSLIPYFYPEQSLAAFSRRFSPGSVILDLGSQKRKQLKTLQLLELVIQTVRNVHVSQMKDQYCMKRGIPQGARLSSALCHIYYGQMVQDHLSEDFLSAGSSSPNPGGSVEADMLVR